MRTLISAIDTPGRSALAMTVVALVLFAPSMTTFHARVTDLSALRVLNGDIPYRDFWTMYAPGSFLTLALAFAVVGRELIVSNALGVICSAAAVGVYFSLLRGATGLLLAGSAAVLVAIAFFGTGYHSGFTSYPPALLLILIAVRRLTRSASERGSAWAVVPGALLGAAAVFKHDIAVYAAVAAAAAIVVTRFREGHTPIWSPVLVLAAAAAVAPLATVASLVVLGAGPDLWDNLVRFPSTYFPHVRPENFPVLPRLDGTPVDIVKSLVRWLICNGPLFVLAGGVYGVWQRHDRMTGDGWFLATFAFVAFWLHWFAAHVQLNTHAISIGAWSLAVAAAAVGSVSKRPVVSAAFLAVVAVWGLAFLAEPVYSAMTRAQTSSWIGLPGLTGIRAPEAQAQWMRDLAGALDAEDVPEAPLLVTSHRNHVHIYAESVPYWLTSRRPATRHHELHPGVTDTAPVQARIIASVSREPLPVVVREIRFTDAQLEPFLTMVRDHVPVGSHLLDEWIDQHYQRGPRFGAYELLRRRVP
jgi:hypothetical protein